jgi:hypothetical protein
MNGQNWSTGGAMALPRLRRFAARPEVSERCDLCATPIGAAHRHLLRVADRKLLCACDACVILLAGGPAAGYRAVPRRVQWWPGFNLTDRQWRSLGIPVDLAFFVYRTSARQVVALCPGPAGAAQFVPPAAAWQELCECNPILGDLEPEVESLLVNRTGSARDVFRAPIDQCFRLAGIVRMRWRGLSGGDQVWSEVAAFFAQLKQITDKNGNNHA